MFDDGHVSNLGKEIKNRVTQFGQHINKLVSEKHIDFIVPLETKGALLLDIACSLETLPKTVNIIYPRALRYLDTESICSKTFLLVDDIFFSGNHLKRIYEHVIKYGANVQNVHCVTFLDFSSGKKNIDYEGTMHDLVKKNLLQGPPIKRKETLSFLQSEMLAKTMPSVYDHLTVEAKNVDQNKFSEILRLFSQINRLLYYGKRGSYHASSILLDDIFPGTWDVPPKVRLWWNPEKELLRITPVGFVAYKNKICEIKSKEWGLHHAIVDSVVSKSEFNSNESEYEAHVLTCRIQQLLLLKSSLQKLGLKLEFENDHLDRYYPNLKIANKIQQILANEECQLIPIRANEFGDFIYYKAVVETLHLIKNAYHSQKVQKPKDRKKIGYTATELFNLLPQFSKEIIHSALDFCFDYHYLAVFRRRRDGIISRGYRTTEISQGLPKEELYGVAVIYSLSKPTPDWLLNKVFAIITNVRPGLNFENYFTVSKAYFGDVTRIKQTENINNFGDSDVESCWKDVDSEFWETLPSGEGVHYVKKEDPEILDQVEELMIDEELATCRDTLTACVFLLNNGGKNSGVLLDILTAGYGGVEYVAHNLIHMISFSKRIPSFENSKAINSHYEGARQKIQLLLELFSKSENVLTKLERRCSRLQETPLLRKQAENIVKKAKPFRSPRLYNALELILNSIHGSISAVQRDHYHGFYSAMSEIGIEVSKKSKRKKLRSLFKSASIPIYRTLYAMQAQPLTWKYYAQYLLGKEGQFKIILGYDLTAKRKEKCKIGHEISRLDEYLHKFIANWIIAFNGKLSTIEMNAGDLRFGFFNKFEEALCAASWLTHHINELNNSGASPIGAEALGIVISSGTYKSDSLGNLYGETLDTSGHWLKGKIVELDALDAVTGKVGRMTYDFNQSQVWIMETEAFSIDRLRYPMVSSIHKFNYNDKYVNIAAVDTETFIESKPSPWHRNFI